MIVHLANPQNLQALLQHLRALSGQSSHSTDRSQATSTSRGANTLQEP